jgi:hypothetical protein
MHNAAGVFEIWWKNYLYFYQCSLLPLNRTCEFRRITQQGTDTARLITLL